MNTSALTSYFYSLSQFSRAALRPIARFLHLRDRNLLTRQNRLRFRYVVSASVLLVALSAFSLSHSDQAPETLLASGQEYYPAQSEQVAEQLAEQLAATIAPERLLSFDHSSLTARLNQFRDPEGQIRRDSLNSSLQEVESEIAQIDQQPEPLAPKDLEVKIGRGETLSHVLTQAGLANDDAKKVVRAVTKHYNPRNLKAGQKFDLRLEPDAKGQDLVLAKASFVLDPVRTLHIERHSNGDFKSHLDEKPVREKRLAARVVIDGSLYGSADRAGLPDRVTANAIRLFSYTIDFQRDVREGDRLEVLYDTQQTDDGYIAKTGDIVFARMTLGGREYELYRFKTKDGGYDYFTPEGRSIRKGTGLMKTPVSVGRMTSGFGMRRHPVLGYTKMHRGVDFAAPIGTPVYAAADGVVEKAGRFSSYGNYIRLRHSAKLGTAYAHLSRYGDGIRPGVRVKQGQVIGYVGNTGRSTGPHLHYEVLINGVQVNPKSVKVAVDNSLKGEELRKFKAHIRSMNDEYVQKASNNKLASAQLKNGQNTIE